MEIYYESGGYDCTKYTFYILERETEKTKFFREIGKTEGEDDRIWQHVVTPDETRKREYVKKIRKTKQYSGMYKWDGKPKLETSSATFKNEKSNFEWMPNENGIFEKVIYQPDVEKAYNELFSQKQTVAQLLKSIGE